MTKVSSDSIMLFVRDAGEHGTCNVCQRHSVKVQPGSVGVVRGARCRPVENLWRTRCSASPGAPILGCSAVPSTRSGRCDALCPSGEHVSVPYAT